MHEYSIVEALIERVTREAEARHAKRIVCLHVKLGELSGVEPDLLVTAYDTFRERTICENAPMLLDRVAAAWTCPRCGEETRLRCARCGVPARLTAGDEIVLQRIEMEVSDV